MLTQQQIEAKAERRLNRLITLFSANPPEGLTGEDAVGFFTRNREQILGLLVATETRAAKKAEKAREKAKAKARALMAHGVVPDPVLSMASEEYHLDKHLIGDVFKVITHSPDKKDAHTVKLSGTFYGRSDGFDIREISAPNGTSFLGEFVDNDGHTLSAAEMRPFWHGLFFDLYDGINKQQVEPFDHPTKNKQAYNGWMMGRKRYDTMSSGQFIVDFRSDKNWKPGASPGTVSFDIFITRPAAAVDVGLGEISLARLSALPESNYSHMILGVPRGGVASLFLPQTTYQRGVTISVRVADLFDVFKSAKAPTTANGGNFAILFRASVDPNMVCVTISQENGNRHAGRYHYSECIPAETNGAQFWQVGWSFNFSLTLALKGSAPDARVVIKTDAPQGYTENGQVFSLEVGGNRLPSLEDISEDIQENTGGTEDNQWMAIDTAILADMMKVVLPGVAKANDTRVWDECLNITINHKSLSMFATDGHRLFRAAAALKLSDQAREAITASRIDTGPVAHEDELNEVCLLIFRDVVKMLLKELLKAKAGPGTSQVFVRSLGSKQRENAGKSYWVEFHFGGVVIGALPNHEYKMPSFSQVMPGRAECWCVIANAKEAARAMRTVQVRSDGIGGAWMAGDREKAVVTLFPSSMKGNDTSSNSQAMILPVTLSHVVGSPLLGGKIANIVDPEYMADAFDMVANSSLLKDVAAEMFMTSMFCSLHNIQEGGSGPPIVTAPYAMFDPTRDGILPFRVVAATMGRTYKADVIDEVNRALDVKESSWDFDVKISKASLLRVLVVASEVVTFQSASDLKSLGASVDFDPRVLVQYNGELRIAVLPFAANAVAASLLSRSGGDSLIAEILIDKDYGGYANSAAVGGVTGVLVSLKQLLAAVRSIKDKIIILKGSATGEIQRDYLLNLRANGAEEGDFIPVGWKSNGAADHSIVAEIAEQLWRTAQKSDDCPISASDAVATVEDVAQVALRGQAREGSKSTSGIGFLSFAWLSGHKHSDHGAFWLGASDGHMITQGRIVWPAQCQGLPDNLATHAKDPDFPYYFGGINPSTLFAAGAAMDGASFVSTRVVHVPLNIKTTLMDIVEGLHLDPPWQKEVTELIYKKGGNTPKDDRVFRQDKANLQKYVASGLIEQADVDEIHGLNGYYEGSNFIGWVKNHRAPSAKLFEAKGIRDVKGALDWMLKTGWISAEQIEQIPRRYHAKTALVFEAWATAKDNASIMVFGDIDSTMNRTALVKYAHDESQLSGRFYLRKFWSEDGLGPITRESIMRQVSGDKSLWTLSVDADKLIAAMKRALSANVNKRSKITPDYQSPLPLLVLSSKSDVVQIKMEVGGDVPIYQTLPLAELSAKSVTVPTHEAKFWMDVKLMLPVLEAHKGGEIFFVCEHTEPLPPPEPGDERREEPAAAPVKMIRLIKGRADVANLIMPVNY